MDINKLKMLIRMITETDITEFEMKSSDEKIIIRRCAKSEYVEMPAVPAAHNLPQSMAPQRGVTTQAGASTTADEIGEAITSPIVGTFYCAPKPGAAPYVKVGQIVEKGEMFCIVEAMKLMNEIEADFRCKIIRTCKENEQAVEYGDLLFIVERI